MKNVFLSATLIALAAGSASAQVVFETGDVTLGYGFNPNNADASLIDLGIRGDYALGGIGVQLDGYTGFVAANPLQEVTEFGVTGHVYVPFSNGAKIGAYVGYEYLSTTSQSDIEILDYGLEGMMSFGGLNLEAFVGFLDITTQSTDPVVTTGLTAAYEISPSFEVSVNYDAFMFEGETTLDMYGIGIEYALNNMPVTLGATYNYVSGLGVNDSGIVQLNVGYAFGAPTDERLFGARHYPLYALMASSSL